MGWMVVLGFFRVLYRLRMRGRDRVPRAGALIYVVNHQSHFDPPLVGVTVNDRPCAFLARASLFEWKPFAWLIRSLNAIPLERERGGREALRSAIGVLEQGRCVLLFPEGTRTRDGSLGRFKRGFLLLARKTGATVVPVAIEGAHDVWARGRSRPHMFGRIMTMVGEPIEAEELLAGGDDAAVERVRRAIEGMRLVLREALRRRTKGRVPKEGAGDVAYWEREGAV